jgi:hypothetical protein
MKGWAHTDLYITVITIITFFIIIISTLFFLLLIVVTAFAAVTIVVIVTGTSQVVHFLDCFMSFSQLNNYNALSGRIIVYDELEIV